MPERTNNKIKISTPLFEWLKKELAQWQKLGIVDQTQIQRILGQYQAKAAPEEKEEVRKKTIKYILIIGAILIGIGIFSFVAAHWKAIGDAAKISLIIISMLTCYIGGWHLKEKTGYKKTGEVLIFLGAIIYGASIFLIAQIFHIRANWPDGFILWMLGTMALAFALDSFLLFILCLPLGVVALTGHPFGIFRHFLGPDRLLLTSNFLLLVATISTFFAGWFIRKKIKPEDKKLI